MIKFVISAVLIILRTEVSGEGGCFVGQLPKNGWIESTLPPFRKLSSDEYIDSLTSVAYKCEDNYFTDGSSVNTCFERKWIDDVPDCKPYCRPEEISKMSFVPSMCSLNGVERQCSEPAPPGTIAFINCRKMYEREAGKNNEQVVSCGTDGHWNPAPEDCSIVCGIVKSNTTKTPWNVHVNYATLRAFGTIINDRMVLTIPVGFLAKVLTPEVLASLSYVSIVRENYFKTIGIQRLVYAPNFNKNLNSPTSGNIVVIALHSSIEFTSEVMPICLPFELKDNFETMSSFTGHTPQQDNLKLQLPTNCFSELDDKDKKPLTAIDEFCTNPLKMSDGDIVYGAGFAVPIIKNDTKVFYLLGIRAFRQLPTFNGGIYFLFQNVLFYKDFIQSEIIYEDLKNVVPENSTILRSSTDESVNIIPENERIACGIAIGNITRTPWDVRVVNELTSTFGFGSIINARLVLTFSDVTWNRLAEETYDLGQMYVTIVRENIIHQQMEIERIAYPPNHMKRIHFLSQGNIAAVILRLPIQFNSDVVPICLPFDVYANGTLPDSVKGRTISKDDVELQNPENCHLEFGTSKPLAVIDVLCSKLTKVDMTSGSGFAIPIMKNGTEVFHILGVETRLRKYNHTAYLEFQNVLHYKEFILGEIRNVMHFSGINSNVSHFDGDTVSTTSEPIPCGKISQNITKTPWNARVEFTEINIHTPATIINNQMVLSLATKFFDRTTRKAYDLSTIYVSIVINNIVHQEIEIKRVAYAPNFNKFDPTPSSGNIVVIVLRTAIEFKSYIQPICLPFELYADGVTPSRFHGVTSQQESIELQSPENCYSELNSSNKVLVTIDVLCTNQLKLSLEDIELYSSFVVPMNKDGDERFYLIGIQTWSRLFEDITYLEFQNVLFYKDFIESEIAQEKQNNSQISPSFAVNTSYCRVDNIPINGNAYFESTDQQIKFGEILGIIYRCIENHILYGDPTNVCLDGEWVFQTPECKPRCNPKDIQGLTIKVNCQFWEGNVLKQISCTEPAVPGTIATIDCESGYERLISNQQTTTCGSDGRWNPVPEKCTPICGQISQGAAFIVGGKTSEISNVPWHIGIYRKHKNETEQVCGGSIISPKIIISAIHCFWDAATDKINDMKEYIVAVGKSLRQFNATENLMPQFFEIDKIFYEETYNDYAGNYANDIAVAVLNKFIEFKSYIAPVCIQFGLEYDDRNIQPGSIGKVAGWGIVQVSGEPSPVLREIELPVVSRNECKEQSTMEYRPFITNDKFCAGYLTGRGVCRGDSGGGLALLQTKGSKTVYFLRGIVSSGATLEGSCANNKYTAFTNVAYYSNFIEKLYLEYDPQL